MRETLSLFRLYHWRVSFWSGHYFYLIRQWGWKSIFFDSLADIKIKTGAGLIINPHTQESKYLWRWQKMPKGFRWY